MLNVAPATVKAFEVPVKPVNPDTLEPAFNVKVPVVSVIVPVPLIVPLLVKPLGIVGLLPKGKVHPLLTVFTPVCPVKLTKLKVTLLQDNVAVVPEKSIVPPFALKVGEPEIVNAPEIVVVPDEAVNVPPDKVNPPLNVPPAEGNVKLPELTVKAPPKVAEL